MLITLRIKYRCIHGSPAWEHWDTELSWDTSVLKVLLNVSSAQLVVCVERWDTSLNETRENSVKSPHITTTPDPLSIKRNMWVMQGNLIGRITSHYGWTLLSDFCMWPFKAHDFTLKRLESGDSYDSLGILRSENNSSHFGIRLGNLRVVMAVPLGQTDRSVVRLYVTVVRWPMRTKCHLRAQCNSARTYNPRRTSFWSRIPKVPSRSVYPTGSSTKGGGGRGRLLKVLGGAEFGQRPAPVRSCQVKC